MMRLAIMQPYFFPYIGYWQLIQASDCFVAFDDAQYMRHGWVNRNRTLKPGGGWQYIIVPLSKHGRTDRIRDVNTHPDGAWKNRIIAQLAHYKKKAPYFGETMRLIGDILLDPGGPGIAAVNLSAIRKISAYLGMDTDIVLSSEKRFDYTNVGDAGEWALRISEQMGADEYINPISGAGLFNRRKFAASGIRLSFLKSEDIVYAQHDEFEPGLSIIDVLMFNGLEGTRGLLKRYSIDSDDVSA